MNEYRRKRKLKMNEKGTISAFQEGNKPLLVSHIRSKSDD
jgi:hypothetical protein